MGETSSTQAPVGQGTASKRVEHVYLGQDGFHRESRDYEAVSSTRLYSFAGCTGAILRSDSHPLILASFADVVLGRLHSSLGFGGVVGGPLPLPVRGHEIPYCCCIASPSGPPITWALSSVLTGAPKTHIGGAGVSARQVHEWPCLNAPMQRSGPLFCSAGLRFFRPNFFPSACCPSFSLGVCKVLPGFSPNPSGFSHAGVIVASCWPPICQPAQPSLSAVLQSSAPGCEYLRGVSVVQGLPPQPLHITGLLLPGIEVELIDEAVGLFFLQLLAACLVPLTRSLLALVFLALMRTLAVPWRFSTPLGRAYCFPLSGVCPRFLRPLGQATCAGHVLDWRPWCDRKGRVCKPGQSDHTRRRVTLGPWLFLPCCLSVCTTGRSLPRPPRLCRICHMRVHSVTPDLHFANIVVPTLLSATACPALLDSFPIIRLASCACDTIIPSRACSDTLRDLPPASAGLACWFHRWMCLLLLRLRLRRTRKPAACVRGTGKGMLQRFRCCLLLGRRSPRVMSCDSCWTMMPLSPSWRILPPIRPSCVGPLSQLPHP